jgi:hypothetical protein
MRYIPFRGSNKKITYYFVDEKGKTFEKNDGRRKMNVIFFKKRKKFFLFKKFKKRKYNNKFYNSKIKNKIIHTIEKIEKIEKTEKIGLVENKEQSKNYELKKNFKILDNMDINFTEKKIDKRYYDIYEYKTIKPVNQKNIFKLLDLNKYMDKKYKNVKLLYTLSLYDQKQDRYQTILKLNFDNVKKDYKEGIKKFPSALAVNFDINFINFLYFSVRKKLAQRAHSFTPQAFKFPSEIKQQTEILDGKKIPHRKLKLLQYFNTYIEVSYDR